MLLVLLALAFPVLAVGCTFSTGADCNGEDLIKYSGPTAQTKEVRDIQERLHPIPFSPSLLFYLLLTGYRVTGISPCCPLDVRALLRIVQIRNAMLLTLRRPSINVHILFL